MLLFVFCAYIKRSNRCIDLLSACNHYLMPRNQSIRKKSYKTPDTSQRMQQIKHCDNKNMNENNSQNY